MDFKTVTSAARTKLSILGYVLSGTVAGVALVISCQAGPAKSQAQTIGSAGGNGTPSSGGGSGGQGGGVTCTPNAWFCDGDMRWHCTKSGSDATDGTDCTLSGSASNPGSCSAGVCVRSQPVCSWTVTAPFTSSGSTNVPTTMGTCSPPPASACGGNFSIVLETPGTCSVNVVELSLDRTKVQPGSITLPNPAVSLAVTGGCSTWAGTVNWISDTPNWRVQLNATCTAPAGNTTAVNGTFSGSI